MPFVDQQLVQPRRRELLLPARPVFRGGQERLNPGADFLPHRPGARPTLPPDWQRPFDVLAHRDTRDRELLRNLPLRTALHPTPCDE